VFQPGTIGRIDRDSLMSMKIRSVRPGYSKIGIVVAAKRNSSATFTHESKAAGSQVRLLVAFDCDLQFYGTLKPVTNPANPPRTTRKIDPGLGLPL
jgi:hypothetical protein